MVRGREFPLTREDEDHRQAVITPFSSSVYSVWLATIGASEKLSPRRIFFFFYFSEIEMHVELYGLYLSCDRFFE